MFDDYMITDKTPKVYLSERNLRTLLSKLERERLGDPTDCALIKEQTPSPAYRQTMKRIAVIAVQDSECYGAQARSPSLVHPSDAP